MDPMRILLDRECWPVMRPWGGAVAVHTGLLFISRFRELRGAKGSKLSPELRFALAFVAPKVQVGIGASLVPARVLSRTWYTKVQGFYYNG